MDVPEPKPVAVDAEETLVAAARRFMMRHPDVQAVGLTVISKVIDPAALSTIIVGASGPLVTPDIWLLASRRFLDASTYCNGNAQALTLGLDELVTGMAKAVEGLRDEQRRLQTEAGGPQVDPRADPEKGDRGGR